MFFPPCGYNPSPKILAPFLHSFSLWPWKLTFSDCQSLAVNLSHQNKSVFSTINFLSFTSFHVIPYCIVCRNIWFHVLVFAIVCLIIIVVIKKFKLILLVLTYHTLDKISSSYMWIWWNCRWYHRKSTFLFTLMNECTGKFAVSLSNLTMTGSQTVLFCNVKICDSSLISTLCSG